MSDGSMIPSSSGAAPTSTAVTTGSSGTTTTVLVKHSATPPPSTSLGGIGSEQWTVYINQRMSGMPKATTLPEWQLQAVLFHSKLTQYYDKFISLGGDDIDQLMQCDETEFLEIMRLIGMASKPLHVRRFQRTLAEFSKDRIKFLSQSISNIGSPPMMDFPTSSSTSGVQAALQYLTFGSSSSSSTDLGMPNPTLLPTTTTHPMFFPPTITSTVSAPSATANILSLNPDNMLMNLVGQQMQIPTPLSMAIPASIHAPMLVGVSSTETQSPAAVPGPSGLASPMSDSEAMLTDFEGGVLSDSDIPVIAKLARAMFEQSINLHHLEPRFVQNKKKLPKDLIDAMQMPRDDPTRLTEYRKYSAIYGRYDAKRKPDKPLSYHELLVNEAAAQLCLLQPVLLTRRDELFPLARKVVRESNFPGFKIMQLSRYERKRNFEMTSERSQSPHSSVSNRSISPEPSSSEPRAASANSMKGAASDKPGTPAASTADEAPSSSVKRTKLEG